MAVVRVEGSSFRMDLLTMVRVEPVSWSSRANTALLSTKEDRAKVTLRILIKIPHKKR